MSIESKEIKDIYSLYQNLYEETARERFQRRKEEIKNPFGKTTIQTKDGKELKQGDPGFEDALKNARETVRNANNKSLGNKNSDTVTSKGGTERTVTKNKDGKGITITKKDLDSETEDLIANTPTIKDRKFGGTGTKTVYNKDGSKTVTKGHSDDIGTGSFGGKKASSDAGKKLLNPEKEKVTPPAPKLNRETGTPDKRTPPKVTRDEIKLKDPGVITPKVKKPTGDVGFDGKPVTPGNRGSSIPVTRDGKIKPGIQKDGKGGFEKKPVPKPVEKPVEKPVAKPVPVAAKPKITARSQMRQRNIDRFGADKVNNLINKQKDFKSMQAKSMMPGAKPGAAKAEFAKKNPDSNIAKDLKKSKRVTSVMDMMDSYDTYDLVLIHLLETNQVDTIEEANYVMTEMDGKTILEIKKLMESMPDYVRDSIGRQYGTGKYKGQKYTIEDKKNVINWYSRIKA